MRIKLNQRQWVISIHALREEGDLSGGTMSGQIRSFLSTPSARRATGVISRLYHEGIVKFLSTPSARRATCQSMKTMQMVS